MKFFLQLTSEAQEAINEEEIDDELIDQASIDPSTVLDIVARGDDDALAALLKVFKKQMRYVLGT